MNLHLNFVEDRVDELIEGKVYFDEFAGSLGLAVSHPLHGEESPVDYLELPSGDLVGYLGSFGRLRLATPRERRRFFYLRRMG